MQKHHKTNQNFKNVFNKHVFFFFFFQSKVATLNSKQEHKCQRCKADLEPESVSDQIHWLDLQMCSSAPSTGKENNRVFTLAPPEGKCYNCSFF